MKLSQNDSGNVQISQDDDIGTIKVQIVNLEGQLNTISIDALADVEMTNGVSVGQFLIWDGFNWVNATPVNIVDVDDEITDAIKYLLEHLRDTPGRYIP